MGVSSAFAVTKTSYVFGTFRKARGVRSPGVQGATQRYDGTDVDSDDEEEGEQGSVVDKPCRESNAAAVAVADIDVLVELELEFEPRHEPE